MADRLTAIHCSPERAGAFLLGDYDCAPIERGPDQIWRPAGSAVKAGGPASGGNSETPAFPSPDGRWLAEPTDSGIHLRDLASGEERREWTLPGTFRELCWSSDSRRMAAIYTHQEEPFDFDELIVLER